MTDYSISEEQFKKFYIALGITNQIDIDMGYKLYLAMLSQNSENIKIAENNVYWNNYLRYQGRLT